MKLEVKKTYKLDENSVLGDLRIRPYLLEDGVWYPDTYKDFLTMRHDTCVFFVLEKGKSPCDSAFGSFLYGYVFEVFDLNDNYLDKIFVAEVNEKYFKKTNDVKGKEDHTGQIYNPFTDTWSWL